MKHAPALALFLAACGSPAPDVSVTNGRLPEADAAPLEAPGLVCGVGLVHAVDGGSCYRCDTEAQFAEAQAAAPACAEFVFTSATPAKPCGTWVCK